jgi:hypothetical protein
MCQPAVCDHTSGSWRCNHNNLGPMAWLLSAEPPRSRIASAP